jgi:hypothetical protein
MFGFVKAQIALRCLHGFLFIDQQSRGRRSLSRRAVCRPHNRHADYREIAIALLLWVRHRIPIAAALTFVQEQQLTPGIG